MTWQTDLVDEVARAAAQLLPVPVAPTAAEIAALVPPPIVPTAGEIAALVPVVPGPPGASPFALLRDFDDAFSRFPKDDDRVKALNDANLSATGCSPAYVVNRRITHTVPLAYVSGMALLGGRMAPAREYGRGPGFIWAGPDGSSQWIFPVDMAGKPLQPGEQKYPNAVDARDVSVRFLEFMQTPTTDCIPTWPYKAASGHNLWYVEFHGCGFRNGRRLVNGSASGLSFTGPTHIQGYVEPALEVGGSESAICDGSTSYADSQTDAPRALMIWGLSKSTLGEGLMITARKQAWGLTVARGSASKLHARIDAQGGVPMHGAAVRVTGGSGHLLAVGVKGAMNAPGSGAGGAAANRADVMVTGGNGLLIQGAEFSREGTVAPATTPVVFVGPNVGLGQVTIGGNTYADGAPKLVHQSRDGQVVCLDPSVKVVTVP